MNNNPMSALETLYEHYDYIDHSCKEEGSFSDIEEITNVMSEVSKNVDLNDSSTTGTLIAQAFDFLVDEVLGDIRRSHGFERNHSLFQEILDDLEDALMNDGIPHSNYCDPVKSEISVGSDDEVYISFEIDGEKVTRKLHLKSVSKVGSYLWIVEKAKQADRKEWND